MDAHRARFVQYPASAINALAFSHTTGDGLRSGNQTSDLRLALGRANGDIEIWDPAKGAWVQEAIFHGGRDRSVEGLAWVQEPDDVDKNGNKISGKLRLFSIGYSSTVTEWDLTTGLPKRQSSGTFAEVWCLAAQPRYKKQDKKAAKASELSGEWRGQNLVAGCADGTLAILTTADDDLQFQKFLVIPAAKKARCLSVAFQNRNTVVAGFADSTIRVFDSRSSTLLRNITVGTGPAGAPREILIWTVKSLPNGDIVSGDSTGEIRFFDGKTFSQFQRINGHEADVLDIAMSHDGRSIWSTGMDRRTVAYVNSTSSSSGRSWAKASHKTHHEHDVKALATFENKKFSMIASGGLDTNLVILPMRGYGTEYHRTISGLPQCQPLVSLPSRRLLASWWGREISIWRISRHSERTKPYKLVAKIVLKSEETIASASITKISRIRHILAVSTAAEIKLFDLIEDISGALAVQKLDHEIQQKAARMLQFSLDSKWLAILDHRNQLQVARIILSSEGNIDIIPTTIALKRLRAHTSQKARPCGALGTYLQRISRLRFSPDGRVLTASDIGGYIDNWVLVGQEDLNAPKFAVPDVVSSDSSDSDLSDTEKENEGVPPITIFGQFWSQIAKTGMLPRLDSAPIILSFRPSPLNSRRAKNSKPDSDDSDQDRDRQPDSNHAALSARPRVRPMPPVLPKVIYYLVVLTAQHQLYEFNLLEGRLSKWSKRNPSSKLPEQFRQIRDRAMDCLWHVHTSGQRLWVWGVNWVWMFELAEDLEGPSPSHVQQPKSISDILRPTKKRRLDGSGAGGRMKQRDMQGLGIEAPETSGLSAIGTQQDGSVSVTNGTYEESEDEDVTLEPLVNGEPADNSDDVGRKQIFSQSAHQKTWSSFKYRPILGIVQIDDVGEVDGAEVKSRGLKRVRANEEIIIEKDAIEVVLVERPVWDLDLPPRFELRHGK